MSRRLVRAAAVVLAFVGGGGIAYVIRSTPSGRSHVRPAAVERVVRALDRWISSSPDELASALRATGSSAGYASPWREELRLAELVHLGNRDELEAFASAAPSGPARARAWLRLSLDGPDRRARGAALEELRSRYPNSAAARVLAPRGTESDR